MNTKDCGMYMVFQVIGAIIAAAVLALLVNLDPGLAEGTTTGANACASENVVNGLVAEIVLTFIFVLVVLGATAKTNGATNNFAGLAIGLALILIHLVGIHYTGTSVNPARSIGPALFEGGKALSQLWVFIVGPFVGGALAACVWKVLEPAEK
jgi:aquaporin Z